MVVVVALLHVSGGPLISFKLGLRFNGFKLGLRFSGFSLGAFVRRLGEWALEEERRKKKKKKKKRMTEDTR